MRNRSGFVLIIVLMSVVILTGLLTLFISEVYLDTGSNRQALDAAQGSLLAASGAIGAQQLLQLNLNNQSYTSLQDVWTKPLILDEEQGQLRISIEEENGKINLNAIALPNGQYNEVYRDIAVRLFKLLKLPLDPTDAIADWIDEDNSPHPDGAEADWYRAQKQPVRPHNKPLTTLEEIKRIKGVAEVFDKIRPFVTVYGDMPAGAPAAPININTAQREVLQSLDDRIDDALARRIIEHRAVTPFKNASELAQVPGMESITTGLLTRISTKGSVYRIRSEGVVNGTTRTVEAVVRMAGSQASILYWREY